VIKFGVNDRGSNGTCSWRIKVRPDTAKLNVIVTGFGESSNLVRERCSLKMKPRFRAEWEVSSEELCIWASLSDEQEFSLRGVKSKRISRTGMRTWREGMGINFGNGTGIKSEPSWEWTDGNGRGWECYKPSPHISTSSAAAERLFSCAGLIAIRLSEID